MSEQIPYGQLERDLCRLVDRRVSEAILSVLQLKEDTGQAYLISLSAASIAAGMWGACFAAHHNLNEPIDLPSALEALAVAMRGEWELLSGFSIDRGSVDAGISANLAAEAADRIEALERERDEARVRFDKHSDYTIQLQRIIEAICHGRELRPDSAELHHHKMAAQFIAASQAEASRLREALDASRATLSDIRTFLVREFGTVDTEVNGVVGWIDEAIGPVQPVAALSSGSKT